MDILEFQGLLGMLQNGDESERIEAKKGTDKVGVSALETISALSNEPGLGGGYLVFGLKKNATAQPQDILLKVFQILISCNASL